MLTSFIGVFEDKLKMHKNEIKEELQKAREGTSTTPSVPKMPNINKK